MRELNKRLEVRSKLWLNALQRKHFEKYIKPHHKNTMSHIDPDYSYYDEMASDPFAWADEHIHRFAVEKLLNSIPYPERSALDVIPVGTLLTSDPNACAIQPDDTSCGAVIIIDWVLFTFIGCMVKPILRLLDGPPVPERKVMANRLLDAMEYFISGGSLGNLDTNRYDENLEAMSECIEIGMLIFILGHEYEHILLGHLNEDNVSRTELGFLKFNKSWQQEFEADKKGIELIRQCLMTLEGEILKESASNLPCASPLIMMSLIHMLEKFLGLHYGSWSHPPACDRYDRLVPFVKPTLSEHALAVTAWFKHVVDQPWEKVKR